MPPPQNIGAYREGETMQSKDFVSAIETLAGSVDAFHQRFDIPQIDLTSIDATLDALRQRLSLLDEEVGEHARALNRGEIEDAVKEAVDVAYIALGTIHRLGSEGLDACHVGSAERTTRSHRRPIASGLQRARCLWTEGTCPFLAVHGPIDRRDQGEMRNAGLPGGYCSNLPCLLPCSWFRGASR